MGGLAISNKVLDKYFGYLKNLDNKAKKSLIAKLTKSISRTKPSKKIGLSKMYGAWDDDRNSDEIISDIKSSRVEKPNTESFE
ncbi:MAG TPA: hypothetical protein VFM65_00370 [Flavobacteriaceae bacterium]|nr:hypothetical protein [Flavobacteriaceae bacterium]